MKSENKKLFSNILAAIIIALLLVFLMDVDQFVAAYKLYNGKASDFSTSAFSAKELSNFSISSTILLYTERYLKTSLLLMISFIIIVLFKDDQKSYSKYKIFQDNPDLNKIVLLGRWLLGIILGGFILNFGRDFFNDTFHNCLVGREQDFYRVFFSGFVLALCVVDYKKIYNTIKNIDSLPLYKKLEPHFYKIILVSGIAILFTRIIHFKPTPATYSAVSYYMNYTNFGFVRRAFIGEIFYRLFGYYIPLDSMRLYSTISSAVCGVIIVLLVYFIVRKRIKKDILVLTLFLVFLISPVSSLFTYLTGRFEIYMLLLAVLSMYFAIRNDITMWLIPVICFIGPLIHTSFAFEAFPLIFIVLVYRWLINPDKEKYASNAAICIISTCICVGGFFYLEFFSYKNAIVNYDEALQTLIDRALGWEYPLQANLIREIILSPFNEAIQMESEWTNITPQYIVENFITRIVFYIPLFIGYLYTFYFMAKKIYHSLKSYIILLMPFTLLVFVALYGIACDYGRWSTALIYEIILGNIFMIVNEKDFDLKKYKELISIAIFVFSVVPGVIALFR
ncbi:MAG: hypothetical protein K6B41_01190 [Butyrivibrio sp.]|nr:hypothetical protein [Butyrivibrio sp.]